MSLANRAPSTASRYLRPPIPIGAVVAKFIIAGASSTSQLESPTISSASMIHPTNIIYQQPQRVLMRKYPIITPPPLLSKQTINLWVRIDDGRN